jgi:hypothetical protein
MACSVQTLGKPADCRNALKTTEHSIAACQHCTAARWGPPGATMITSCNTQGAESIAISAFQNLVHLRRAAHLDGVVEYSGLPLGPVGDRSCRDSIVADRPPHVALVLRNMRTAKL